MTASNLFCGECKDRNICKAICKPLDKYLKSREISGYSLSHRKRKEVVYDPQKIEDLGARVAFRLKYGKKYPLSIEKE